MRCADFDSQPPKPPQPAHVKRALCIAALDPMMKLTAPQAGHGAWIMLTTKPATAVLGAVVAAPPNKSNCRRGVRGKAMSLVVVLAVITMSVSVTVLRPLF